MKEYKKKVKYPGLRIVVMLFLIFASGIAMGQNIRFGVFADPSVNWFSSNSKETVNDGARSGFSFGINFNKYFSRNYSFSTGISMVNTGGRLITNDDITMRFNNLNIDVDSGESVVYRLQYVNIPIGLRFESTQIGYVRIFVDAGIDPRLLIGSKADIPSKSITGETAGNEVLPFNLSYHVMGGIAYSLGGDTEMVIALGFDRNFLDVTRETSLQPDDKVQNNMIKLRIGINF